MQVNFLWFSPRRPAKRGFFRTQKRTQGTHSVTLIDEYFNVCEEAARSGGRILRDYLGRVAVREKGPRDLVTEADLASQEAIKNTLLSAFPEHRFVGEEETADDGPQASGNGDREAHRTESDDSPYRWIVDPLDGTTNYVHQMPTFSVSVALERSGEILVGVIYDPIREECFSAKAGGGAHLNGVSLRTSGCGSLSKALVAASFSANIQRDSLEIDRFIDVLVACQSMRRLGSAALNLSYLAAGRLDAYYATSVCTWDVAAGILIAREAGGIVTAIDGTPFRLDHPHFVAASSAELHTELLRVLERPLSGGRD